MNKIIEFGYRIIAYALLESIITILGFVGLMNTIRIFEELNSLTLSVQIIITLFALGIAYLTVVNFCYWFLEINLLDYKKLNKRSFTKSK